MRVSDATWIAKAEIAADFLEEFFKLRLCRDQGCDGLGINAIFRVGVGPVSLPPASDLCSEVMRTRGTVVLSRLSAESEGYFSCHCTASFLGGLSVFVFTVGVLLHTHILHDPV